MRKFILFSTFICTSFFTFGQDYDLLYNSKEFVWCGLDYSYVRCIGSQGFEDPKEIRDKYFVAWNQLILDESDKYDLEKAYQKNQRIDLSVAIRRNKNVNIDSLLVNDLYQFKKGDLTAIISDYNLEKEKEGLGLVYIIESLNKRKQEASIYTVFFNIATKEILWVRKFRAGVQCCGFRNYWARPIYEIIKDSRFYFKQSKKQYLKNLKKR